MMDGMMERGRRMTGLLPLSDGCRAMHTHTQRKRKVPAYSPEPRGATLRFVEYFGCCIRQSDPTRVSAWSVQATR